MFKRDKADTPKTATTAGKKLYFLRISIKDQVLFAKRLSILITSGVPIMQALNMIRNQRNSRATQHIMHTLTRDVENGQALSASMAKFRKVFGSFAINIVRVGEVSGSLHENLNYLADELKKKQELRRKVISALVYPVFIAIATLGITVLLTAYVFPKILPIFQNFTAQLPWTTRVLIFISNIFINYWYLLLAGIILLVVGTVLLLRVEKVRLRFDKFTMYMPLLGPMFQAYQVANFCRTLGLLLKSDVRIVEALNITASTIGNYAYRKEFVEMADTIQKGERISQHMEKNSKLFPTMLAQMIAVGKSTGNLTNTLLYLASMYEDDLNNATKNLSTVIEPVLMIFMGLLVGFIAISIITPIYSITQNLRP